jgi:hypothetical protein
MEEERQKPTGRSAQPGGTKSLRAGDAESGWTGAEQRRQAEQGPQRRLDRSRFETRPSSFRLWLWLWASCCRTLAVTGPPPKNIDFKIPVIGGSGSPLGSAFDMPGFGLVIACASQSRTVNSPL